MKKTLLAWTLAAVALGAQPALADVIPLADGRSLQGEILSGQTTDDGLAVKMFDTGGVVVVRWEHVLPERAKKLRVEYGIDIPEDESITVSGHVVTLTNGTQVRGVAENVEEYNAGNDSVLQVKMPNGIQTYDKSTVARVDPVEIDAKEAYTTPELYARKLAENPPETAAAHFALGEFCQAIGDYDHAKEHYEAAKADAEFAETNDGKSLDARIARADIMIRAGGAQELVNEINRAKYAKRWNDALAKLVQLDEEFQDEKIRDAIGYDRLQSQVLRGRDAFFKKRVQRVVYDQMEKLIERKVREKKPLRADDESATMSGTLAGARTWAVRELPTALWDKVADSLGLEKEEIDRYWSERASRRVRTGVYGTGSFIVIKRATLPGGDTKRRRPPPGSRRRGDSGGGGPSASRPKSDEEWWDAVRAADRARWIEAYFVENSGIFEIIRTDEADYCDNCAGKGFLASVSQDGGESSTVCPQCNGSGKFRKVLYR